MLKILSVASEIFPLIKTGGLADVTGALPAALLPHGCVCTTLVPGYPAVLSALEQGEGLAELPGFFGGPARLLAAEKAGLKLFVLDAPHLYVRPGNPYSLPDGQAFSDNPARFAALAYAASLIGQGFLLEYRPDIVHAHDWQAALAPAYLHYAGGPRPGTIVTIHNLAFQGQAPANLLASLRLPPHAFALDGVEYYGGIGFLKAGLQLADAITTVSPSYAAEILTPEGGMGLDGLLRARRPALHGILNGIDTEIWNPANDSALPRPYTSRHPAQKSASKAALQARLGLDIAPKTPIFGVVSRLTHQKGMDLLLDCLDGLIAAGAQLAVLGSGEAALQNRFLAASGAHPGRVGVVLGYDEPLAHLMQAGCDALIVPSRFEPCGLTQLCALRYGTIPLVARVGGLADTVIDANEMALAAGVATGVLFSPVTASALAYALDRTLALWRTPATWLKISRNAMATDTSWAAPASQYAALYRRLAA